MRRNLDLVQGNLIAWNVQLLRKIYILNIYKTFFWPMYAMCDWGLKHSKK